MPSPQEQQRETVCKDIEGYFAGVEQRNPDLAKQLLTMIMDLMGNQTFTLDKLQQVEKYLNVGFSVLGDWLKNNDYGGFSVSLSLADKILKKAASAVVTLPKSRNELLAKSGIPQDQWDAANQEITIFSTVIKHGLEVGFTPRMIVGGLLFNSTLQQPNANTSQTLQTLFQEKMGQQMPQVNQLLRGWIQGQR